MTTQPYSNPLPVLLLNLLTLRRSARPQAVLASIGISVCRGLFSLAYKATNLNRLKPGSSQCYRYLRYRATAGWPRLSSHFVIIQVMRTVLVVTLLRPTR